MVARIPFTTLIALLAMGAGVGADGPDGAKERSVGQKHRKNQVADEAAGFCPLANYHAAHATVVGGDDDIDSLVGRLADGETACYSACIRGVQGHESLRGAALWRAQKACRACVDAEAEAQRQSVILAMSDAQNAGCKVGEPAPDRCFITPVNTYEITDRRRSRRSLGEGGTDSKAEHSLFLGGWYGLPEEVRSTEDNGLSASAAGCKKACMPTDGVGSIFSVVFALYAAAFETGCSVVYPTIRRAAHGVNANEIADFFRADHQCLQGDRQADLEPLSHKLVRHSSPAKPQVPGEANRALADDASSANPQGTVYYVSRNEICGPPKKHSFRLSHLRGGMHVCGRRNAGILARLVLRAKFETGQHRPAALPPAPAFVAAVETKASTQLAETAWFDPLRATWSDGRLPLNVVMHVRRGDVNMAGDGTHHSGGIYASHYVPLEVVTEALTVLMAAWAPLAEKLGLFFNIFVASEGTEDDFPVTKWQGIVEGRGKMHYKLRPYEGQKTQRTMEMRSRAANLTALDTMGQMLDADVLMADGKSLFSLTANAWAVNSLFLTYPWLLQLGSPLRDFLDQKNTTGVPEPEPMRGHGVPIHPMYKKMVDEKGPGRDHPGVTLLRDAHQSEDYRSELRLLYEHRQTKMLQGLLANIVAKKQRALERGAHFNWVGY